MMYHVVAISSENVLLLATVSLQYESMVSNFWSGIFFQNIGRVYFVCYVSVCVPT